MAKEIKIEYSWEPSPDPEVTRRVLAAGLVALLLPDLFQASERAAAASKAASEALRYSRSDKEVEKKKAELRRLEAEAAKVRGELAVEDKFRKASLLKR